jgi:hypothetical protein
MADGWPASPLRARRSKTCPTSGFLHAEGWRMHMTEDFEAVPKGFANYV